MKIGTTRIVTPEYPRQIALESGSDSDTCAKISMSSDNFDHIALSFAAKNTLNSGSCLSFTPPTIPDDPNIVDNTPQTGVTVTTVRVPKLCGYNADGTPKMDWGDYGSEENYMDAQRSGTNSGFFHSSTDFFLDAAKQYAKISDSQEFKYRPTKDGDYVGTTLTWLSGGQYSEKDAQAMSGSIDKIVRELADRIKSGGSTDLSTLKNKLSVMGQDISIDDLEKIKQKSFQLWKGTEDYEFGTDSVVEFAKKGIRSAVAGIYANSLQTGLQKSYAAGFHNLMEQSCENNLQVFHSSPFSSIKSTQWTADVSQSIFNLFSGLDTSSKANAISDFSKKMDSFHGILENEYGDNQLISYFDRDIQSLFSKLMTDI